MLDNTNKIYQVSLKQFDWWKKVQGTECQVVRIKEDYDEVRAISHSLKGSAGSLQLDTVYNLCKDMEAIAKDKAHKESNDTYKNLFNNIKDEIGI
jgi:HPt (histidine-containing phosphotransfer) domain-containing protein